MYISLDKCSFRKNIFYLAPTLGCPSPLIHQTMYMFETLLDIAGNND